MSAGLGILAGLLLGACVLVPVLLMAIRDIAQTVGQLGERLMLAGITGIPQAVEAKTGAKPDQTRAFSDLDPMLSHEEAISGQITLNSPALPPLEPAIQRLTDAIEQDFREFGSPVSRAEAERQARAMASEAWGM